MQIVERRLDELQPYENNPRKNENAVPYVLNSINEFGFKVPIIIDDNDVIVTGHTRYLAAKQMGLETVPTIKADDLTPEQINAYRIIDNRTAEYSFWDKELRDIEIKDLSATGIDMRQFGFKSDEGMFDFDITDDMFEDDEKWEEYSCPCCGKTFLCNSRGEVQSAD